MSPSDKKQLSHRLNKHKHLSHFPTKSKQVSSIAHTPRRRQGQLMKANH